MAFFTSTTSSGYSDPLKALNIKALEARQKAQAAMPGEAITPENTQTPIQGIGHVVNQLADSMAQNRTVQALADRQARFQQALAHTDWKNGVTSANISEFAADPEFLRNVVQNEYEGRRLHDTIAGENRRADNQNTTTLENTRLGNTSREGIANAEITGRADVSNAQIKAHHEDVDRTEAGATGREVIRTTSAEDIAEKERASKAELQGSSQQHDVEMAGIKAEIDKLTQERTFLQQDKQTDKLAVNDAKLVELRAKLSDAEAARGRSHDLTKLDVEYSNSAKLEGLRQEGKRYELAATIAAQKGEHEQEREFREKAMRIQAAIDADKQSIAQTFEAKQQTERLKAAEATSQREILSHEKIEASKAATAAAAQAGDPKRAEAIANMGGQYARFSQGVDKLERAMNILNNGGINTGPWARAETAAAMIADGKFGTDKDMAQRTTTFNSIVNEIVIKDMANTLKGSSTNLEMEKFIETLNNADASPEDRKAALQRLIVATKIDRDLNAEAVRKVGGNLDLINGYLHPNAPGGGQPPAPGGGQPPAPGGGGQPPAPGGGGQPPSPAFIQNSRANAAKSIGENPANKPEILKRLQAHGIPTDGL